MQDVLTWVGFGTLTVLIGVGVLVLASVWRYFTYHYRIEDDSIVIRSGLLHRQLPVDNPHQSLQVIGRNGVAAW